MHEKTFIKGKDSDLESSIATMQAKLRSLGFDVEEASWFNPVENCYSLHLRDKACRLMFTNGKGVTAKAALASALGEYFERLSCNLFFADYYLGQKISQSAFVHYPQEKWFVPKDDIMPDGLMDKALWDHFDPGNELTVGNLYDLNSGNGERGICALPYERIRDNQSVYIPVGIIGNIFVSNGMAAGNTRSEARVQALSEILERYVKNKVISEGLCLPEVPREVLNRFPHIMASCDGLEKHGFYLRIADASLGGKYPVMSVTLINPQEGSVFASFGAHPCFEVALERTVTELLQGRRLDQLVHFESPGFDADEIASPENLESHFVNSTGIISFDFFKSTPDFPFVEWNFEGDTAQEYAHLVKIVEDEGYEIYLCDFTHLDVYACRIIVPGLSDIFPVEDLLWSNNNEGSHFRESFLNLINLSRSKWAQILEDLEEGGFSDAQEVAQFINIVPDADTLWETLHLGEVKAMLALALQSEEAIHWVQWCLQFNTENAQKTRQYRCIQALLEIQAEPSRHYDAYHNSLVLLYGLKTLTLCREIVAGKIVFHGLHCPGLSLEGFSNHQSLLTAYEKLQKAKTR